MVERNQDPTTSTTLAADTSTSTTHAADTSTSTTSAPIEYDYNDVEQNFKNECNEWKNDSNKWPNITLKNIKDKKDTWLRKNKTGVR